MVDTPALGPGYSVRVGRKAWAGPGPQALSPARGLKIWPKKAKIVKPNCVQKQNNKSNNENKALISTKCQSFEFNCHIWKKIIQSLLLPKSSILAGLWVDVYLWLPAGFVVVQLVATG
ncbi:hypothetical protein WN944_017030 [Citrus x changshan-huyou]|uniref:Uncharacterized protein n=1 Tax=Citrus x changshan-huyou TaxID=2935761 RepID=A0AAP0MCT0_9ROSI